MALNGLYCADVPLSNYSLTHSLALSFLAFSVASLQGPFVALFEVDFTVVQFPEYGACNSSSALRRITSFAFICFYYV